MFFGNIGNSLHHQIPPNWSSGLRICPLIFFKARVPSQELSNKLIFEKMTQRKKTGNWTTFYAAQKWLNWAANRGPTPTQNPTPPHPKRRFHLLGVSIYLFGHGLAAAAPCHGQVALGTKKVARTLGPGLGPAPPSSSQAAARPWENK